MLYMMDIDGTVIKPFYAPEGGSRHGTDIPVEDYMKVELMPNVANMLARIQQADAHACFALITNQGGVAFDFQTVEQVKEKLGRVIVALEFFRGQPFSVHVCYSHPEATIDLYRDPDDRRRKPGCGMLDEAMVAHRLRSRNTAVYIGDLKTDEQAAAAAGVAFMYAHDFFAPSVQTPSAETN